MSASAAPRYYCAPDSCVSGCSGDVSRLTRIRIAGASFPRAATGGAAHGQGDYGRGISDGCGHSGLFAPCLRLLVKWSWFRALGAGVSYIGPSPGQLLVCLLPSAPGLPLVVSLASASRYACLRGVFLSLRTAPWAGRPLLKDYAVALGDVAARGHAVAPQAGGVVGRRPYGAAPWVGIGHLSWCPLLRRPSLSDERTGGQWSPETQKRPCPWHDAHARHGR